MQHPVDQIELTRTRSSSSTWARPSHVDAIRPKVVLFATHGADPSALRNRGKQR